MKGELKEVLSLCYWIGLELEAGGNGLGDKEGSSMHGTLQALNRHEASIVHNFFLGPRRLLNKII